jgi:hypothetical protein
MIERIDRCIPDLDRFNFHLDQYNWATLNSTIELYKSVKSSNFSTTFLQAFHMFWNVRMAMGHRFVCHRYFRSHTVHCTQHGANFQTRDCHRNTRQLLAGLLALEQNWDLGSNTFSKLQCPQSQKNKSRRAPAANKILCDIDTVFSTFSMAKIKIDYTTSISNSGDNHRLLMIEPYRNSRTSTAYDPPSVRLDQSPILNILSETVATYMFLRHLNNPQDGNQL